uniref:Protein quaking-A (Trinotate prediction) n=1 Tax=Henneguya salminicola TaxID=69463 RepID=A0A6G3MID1_HENSL
MPHQLEQIHQPVPGPLICLTQKLYFAVDKYPTYNFMGRIIGPKGQILKEIEKNTSCRIHVRGKGSSRSKIKDSEPSYLVDANLNEPLNVVIYIEDSEPRARQKMQHAIKVIKPYLIPPDVDKGLLDFQALPTREAFYLGYRNVDLAPIVPVRGIKRTKKGLTEYKGSGTHKMLNK